ncbi:hypothetical protein H9Q09_12045 [Aurantimonas sp. DM33-3]|uniref:hypothetical protein n=1 Tax=Aurantimonas TaxID=182269 RepID=UPI001652640D|nr:MULTISPECIES: hypothetical protein [Aurantimonas]MBC6716940.1 hypothetical protein [Aurantimonas sp. DM33-3]MCC4298414.1 hypothetical protein [Aurantimonas coralicida]
MTGKVWTAEEDRQLAQMVAAGMSSTAIGVELGRSGSAVSLRKHRLDIRSRRPVSQETIDEISNRFESGETRPQIAAAVGLPVSTVYYVIVSRGIVNSRCARRMRAQPPHAHTIKAHDMRRQGHSIPEIAMRTGRDRKWVQAAILRVDRHLAALEEAA